MIQRFIFGIIAFLLVLGCKKEEGLFKTEVSDLYVFRPDDSSPVKKKVYELYRDYGVAVFFKDTVGEYFVRNDVNGNPIYRTERLDLGWTFNTYKNSTFIVDPITQMDEQMDALNYAEKYLKSISKPLYPFSILLVRALNEKSSSGDIITFKSGEAVNYFRTLMMTDKLTSTDTAGHFKEIVKKIIRVKLDGFPDELNKFGAVSKSDWYGGKKYSDLDKTVAAGTSVGILYTPNLVENLRRQGWTEARIEAEKVKLRRVCGQFGFVGGNDHGGGYFTPAHMAMDLDSYVREMLNSDKVTFKKYWVDHPLVMKKYTLLHDLILNQLGVDL